MPERSPLQRLGERLSQLGDFLAGMSLKRFFVLSVLVLVAAGLAESLFDFSPRRPLIQITQAPPPPPPPGVHGGAEGAPGNHGDVQISIGAEGVRVERKAPEKDGATADSSAKDGAPAAAADKEFRVHIGDNGLVISGQADDREVAAIQQALSDTARSALEAQFQEKLDAAISEANQSWFPTVSLPQVAIFGIVLLLIVRFVAQSKVKAEARAVSAETAADKAALERQLAEARLQAMQAQVEPHFLFNTLAAVEHLIETDPPRAAGMQRNLIAYLRSVMPNLRQSESTLGREVEISRNYLEILKVRMEQRLAFTIDVPEGLQSAAMPPLMLQSLVENAIEHGLEPKPEGGSITIAATIRDGKLVVSVADTGAGFDPRSTDERHGAKRGTGTTRGVGLTSIRERLTALFDSQARLIIAANQPSGTRATLEFPYRFNSPENKS